MRKNFFQQLEVTAELFSVTSENSWGAGKEPFATVTGLATITDPTTELLAGSTVLTATVSFAMKPAEAGKLSALKIGDQIKIEGTSYVVEKIDLRGVLPTAYSSKIVAYRRGKAKG